MLRRRPFTAATGAAIATLMSLSTVRAQNAPATSGVYVDLQSVDPRVRIDQVRGDGANYPVCYVPCRKALPREALYVIQGEGIPATTPFVLPSDRPDLTLTVRPGSRARRVTGLTLLFAGLTAMTLGFLLSPADTTQNPPPPPAHPWALLVGLGGIGVAGIGGYLWWTGDTRVSSSSGRTF
jgi:hypothetical protein